MSLKRLTGLLIIAVFALLIIFYIMAIAHELFFYIWWYDIMLHFLGGLGLGLSAVYVCYFSGHFRPRLSRNAIFYTVLFSALLVGVLWEVFENYSGLTYSFGNYRLDTIKDMFTDVFGSIVAYVFFMRNFSAFPYE